MIDPPEIPYLWPVDVDKVSRAKLVCQAARYLTCLGWGIDMAYSDGRLIGGEEAAELLGTRWHHRKGIAQDSGLLRVPVFNHETKENTLDDLKRAHQSALNRVEHGKPLNSVEKLRAFDRVFYESKEKLLARPHIVFELRRDDGKFLAYPQDKLIHITGMVRHLAIEVLRKSAPEGVDDDWLETYVAGHAKLGAAEHRQFSYLPLPSIGHRHADQKVRRVMIVAQPVR